MNRKKLDTVLACVGLDVSMYTPFYAIFSQGADIAIGDICHLTDICSVPVYVREDSPWVDFLKMYESCHHVLISSNLNTLYCAYIRFPRLLLAMRNNKSFARYVINAPLNIAGDRL